MKPRWGRTAAVLGLGACAGAVQANEPAGAVAESTLNKVVVVGSALPDAGEQRTAPVKIITRAEIERSGSLSLAEFLADQPAVSGGFTDLQGGAMFAPGASALSLRGMGAQGTLVLLNSRRIAPYALANYAEVFSNIDALPLEAIERIEILKTGGAALYGSDAIAGVVNIVTREGWTGLTVRATHERSLRSGRFGSSRASVTAGWALKGAQGGHLMAHLDMYQRDQVMWSDVIGDAKARYAGLSTAFNARSSYSAAGNLVGVGALQACGADQALSGYCWYDRSTSTQAVPGARQVALMLNGELNLDANTRAYVELLASDNQTRYRSPPQPYGLALGSLTWGDPRTGEARTFWYRGLPAGHPLNLTGVDDAQIRYRFTDVPNETTAQSQQLRALAGLKGQWQGYDWDAAAGVASGRARAEYRGWWSYSGFHQVIGNDDPSQVDPDFFNRAYQIGQTNSPQVLDTLFPRYGYRGEVQQYFVDGKLSGRLMDGPAGPVQMVLGADLRRERFTIDPDERLRSGDIVANGLSASDGTRNVLALFSELNLPLTNALVTQLAVRLDKYQGVAGHVSPKLAWRYQAAPAWALRGSVEAGFRAPNLTESADSTKFAYAQGVADPARCLQAQALANDLATAAAALPAGDAQAQTLQLRANSVVTNECYANVASVVRNNPELQPETSRSLALGVLFAPARSTQLSVDAWSILRRNEIGFKSVYELIDAEAGLPAGRVIRADLADDRTFTSAEQAQYGVTQGALTSTVARFENTSRTETSGFDLGGQTAWTTPLGRLMLGLDASYLYSFKSWSAGLGGWGDNLAGRKGFPRWKAIGDVVLTTGDWVHNLRAVAVSGTSLQGDYYDTIYSPAACVAAGYTESQCRVGGYTRWDYSVQWRGWRDVRVGLRIRNLFERQVPVDVPHWRNLGSYVPPTDEDARGRMVAVQLEWRPR